MNAKEEILRDAIKTTRERGESYGPPAEHFARTVGMINALFARKLREPLTPADWATFMILDKLSRDQERPKRDNDLDGIGYFACRHEVRNEGAPLTSAGLTATIADEVPEA